MASPFYYFRKYQKAFLAIAAVVAMFVFVVGDAMFSYIGQPRDRSNPRAIVAEWKGGSLNGQELSSLTQRRFFLSEFLKQLRMTGAQRIMEEGGTPMMPSVPDFVLPDNTSSRDVQVGVVTTRILADQAKKAGMTVSDEMINQFLKESSFRRVSDQEIAAILSRIQQGDPRLLEEQLFSGLRELLLGNTYFGSFNSNVRNVLPEQRWEDWRHINERIALQAVAVPASDFVGEVPDPSESELLAFYEQYKDNTPGEMDAVLGTLLPSANPGFKEPRRVKLNYILGDVNSWRDKLRDSITDEEIADYYERNKRTLFVAQDSPTFDESLFESDSEEETSNSLEAEASEENAEAETPVTEESAVESADETEVEILEEQAGAEEAGDVEPETPATPEGDESGSVTLQGKFRLVAFQDNEESIQEDEVVTDEVVSNETSAEENADTSETEAGNSTTKTESTDEVPTQENEDSIQDDEVVSDETVGGETVSSETGSEENAETLETEAGDSETEAESTAEAPTQEDEVTNEVPPDESTGDEEAEKQESPAESTDSSEKNTEETAPEADESSATSENESAEEAQEFVPLEDVKDSIRDKLATDKAVLELKEKIESIYSELESVYNPYGYDVVSARSNEEEIPEPPKDLTNLKERAAEAGLISEETLLVTQRELADTFVGKAIDAQAQRQYVAQAVFSSLAVYEPFLAQDLDGNWYLVTKTQDVPPKIPAFDDIRSVVMAAWKQQKAAQLALKKAEEIGKDCEEAGSTLAKFDFSDSYNVVTTDLFSWLTFGSTAEIQRGPRLGEAPPLEAVGPEFMEKAFELEDKEVAAVLNYDQTVAYVIQLDRRERPKEELHQLFLTEANNWYGGQVMQLARWQNQQRQVLEDLTDSVDLDLEKLEEFLEPNQDEQ